MLYDRPIDPAQAPLKVVPCRRVNGLNSPTLFPIDWIADAKHEFVVDRDIEPDMLGVSSNGRRFNSWLTRSDVGRNSVKRLEQTSTLIQKCTGPGRSWSFKCFFQKLQQLFVELCLNDRCHYETLFHIRLHLRRDTQKPLPRLRSTRLLLR